MYRIEEKDVHIAVLNKQFKTINYQSGVSIWWNESEVVQVINHGEHLWCCIKLYEWVKCLRMLDPSDTHLIVSKSHLDFVEINWETIKNRFE